VKAPFDQWLVQQRVGQLGLERPHQPIAVLPDVHSRFERADTVEGLAPGEQRHRPVVPATFSHGRELGCGECGQLQAVFDAHLSPPQHEVRAGRLFERGYLMLEAVELHPVVRVEEGDQLGGGVGNARVARLRDP